MKKRVLSILITLCLALTLLPVSAWAADNVAKVRTKAELNTALSNVSVTEIQIIADMTYNDPLVASKPVQVNEGVTLTLNDYKTTVSGTIVNNGTIWVKSGQECLWKAETSGSGKLFSDKSAYGSYATYIDYGCVPKAMLGDENYRINIVMDISQSVTATLPENMQTGDTISVTFGNLIDGVNPADVFKFTWKNGSSNQIYDNAATPTLTQAGTLKLSLTPKAPYVMRTSSGTKGSLDAQGTVTQKLLDTIYVDQANGNNSNLGDTTERPVKTVDKAMDLITDGGKIVLLSNYSGQATFTKSVEVTSADGNKYTLTLTSMYPGYVSDGVTVTLNNLALAGNAAFTKYPSGAGTGSLIFKNCSGAVSVGSGSVANITLENCENLDGGIAASDMLKMINSSYAGRFSTNHFTAEGDCVISCKKNSYSSISGTVQANNPVKIALFSGAAPGAKLLEVPANTDLTNFALDDNSNGQYGIALGTQSGRTVLLLVQRISSVGGKLAISGMPTITQTVSDSRISMSGFASNSVGYESATWNGNAKATWSADEIPELTVTLKAYGSYFFDDTFSVADLQIYNWTDLSKAASFTDAEKNTAVTCIVKDGQGVSTDGKFFTFTVKYPKIERLEQVLRMDTTDRTASCKEVLPPRHINNPQGTTLSYESSDPDTALVNQTTGEITALKPGMVTITIHAAQTDTYAAAEISYQLIISHKYSDQFKSDGETHWKECACGERTEAGKHTGGTATCIASAVCETCNQSYGLYNFDNHADATEWIRTATTHMQKYKCCGASVVNEENHEWENGVCTECSYECKHTGGTATCTEQATCEACSEKYGDLKPHSYSAEWSTSVANHWHECTECGAKTDEAEHTDTNKDHKCDVCEKDLSECADTDNDHKCDLCGKTLSEHSGGKATCTDKAKCAVCGESYGELDPNNHANLKHIDAKAATKTAEGNIEYWYCSGCGKYFADKDGSKEINKADTVTAKLPDDSRSPQTEDNSNLLLWIALLLASGGAVTATTVYGRKKRRSVK